MPEHHQDRMLLHYLLKIRHSTRHAPGKRIAGTRENMTEEPNDSDKYGCHDENESLPDHVDELFAVKNKPENGRDKQRCQNKCDSKDCVHPPHLLMGHPDISRGSCDHIVEALKISPEHEENKESGLRKDREYDYILSSRGKACYKNCKRINHMEGTGVDHAPPRYVVKKGDRRYP